MNEVGAEGLAQARELIGGDCSDPQAHAALDGVVEFVGECVSCGGVGEKPSAAMSARAPGTSTMRVVRSPGRSTPEMAMIVAVSH